MSMKKMLINLLPYFLVMCGFFLVLIAQVRAHQSSAETKTISTENNTYLRVMTCIVSVNPEDREPDHTKHCYDEAERRNGYAVDRFGAGK